MANCVICGAEDNLHFHVPVDETRRQASQLKEIMSDTNKRIAALKKELVEAKLARELYHEEWESLPEEVRKDVL